MKLLLHPRTKSQIDEFAAKPSHGLLLEGPDGSGKFTLSKYMCSQLLGLDYEKIANNAHVFVIEAENNTITIDHIRQAQRFVRLKTPGEGNLRRALIFRAGSITLEAQNAFLKMLEEPPEDTIILLNTPTALALLPTIRSRVQIIRVLSASVQEAVRYFVPQGYNEAEITKAYNLSSGRVGLMAAILSGNESHPLLSSVNEAKTMLSFGKFDRLAGLDKFSKDRDKTQQLVAALGIVSSAALNKAANTSDEAVIKRWHKIASLVYDAKSNLAFNPNTKLLLTNLMLNI